MMVSRVFCFLVNMIFYFNILMLSLKLVFFKDNRLGVKVLGGIRVSLGGFFGF